MQNIQPKKHLGQHFLRDKNIAQKITNSLSDSTQNILEIGAGTGALTQFLTQKKGINLQVIDIDKESISYLEQHYPNLQGKIILGDFLKIDIKQLFKASFNIIGNFPYNISSQIFFRILENKDSINEVVCMIQKEVAERISSPEGNKQYGILSVLLQAHYKIEYLFTVSEHAFVPPPKVKSAVIRLTRDNTRVVDYDEKLFFTIVKTSFNQRRKMMRNSLKNIVNTKVLQNSIFEKRPEQLSIDEFIYITKFVKQLTTL